MNKELMLRKTCGKEITKKAKTKAFILKKIFIVLKTIIVLSGVVSIPCFGSGTQSTIAKTGINNNERKINSKIKLKDTKEYNNYKNLIGKFLEQKSLDEYISIIDKENTERYYPNISDEYREKGEYYKIVNFGGRWGETITDCTKLMGEFRYWLRIVAYIESVELLPESNSNKDIKELYLFDIAYAKLLRSNAFNQVVRLYLDHYIYTRRDDKYSQEKIEASKYYDKLVSKMEQQGKLIKAAKINRNQIINK